MYAQWQRLSLTTRLFISFSLFTILVSFISIWIQAGFSIQAKVENMTQMELPNRLQKIKAEVSLIFAPGLAVAQILANDPELPALLAKAETEPVTARAELAQKLDPVYRGLGVDTLALSPSPRLGSTYYQYSNDRLLHRPMHQGDPDDAWYAGFVASKLETRAELDTNTLSQDRRLLFINARSRTLDNQGNPEVVSSVALDARVIVDIINRFRIGERGLISLVSPEGRIDMSPAESRLESIKSDPKFQQLLNPGKESIIELRQGQEDFYLASIWLDSLRRFLIIEIPKDQLESPIRQQTLTTLGISILLLLVSLILFYPLARSLTRPLRLAQASIGNISRNLDLSKRIEVKDGSEIGQVVSETNRLLDRLATVIHAISTSSSQLNESAILLAHTAGLDQSVDQGLAQEQSMASAMAQMSASVTEITSTMEEFSASSTQIADHSESVASMAKGTLESSQRGAQAMADLEQQMAAIQSNHDQSISDILSLGEQSRAISKVMELINTLAEQTRLIAFNAALEASSAGEAGRRFSVVASEIRRLADSVSGSTKDIEQHIQDIQEAINRLVITSEKSAKSVQTGLEVSASTAAELDSLVKAAGHTSDAALQISMSTKQQKTASNQVTHALRSIANASTSNARSIHSISQISEEMLKLANQLNQLISEFTLQKD